ncbi:thermonuclease family protein [Ruegeria sp. ANG-S4]|uniref:thermonuclease family protein n=1 Tax=Ruegeria sp. ANG-S4 TaxID=1577904 RepID=UPI0009E627DC|nr:thermonuclease family protein [Ruegeria sp. ANG-S4]
MIRFLIRALFGSFRKPSRIPRRYSATNPSSRPSIKRNASPPPSRLPTTDTLKGKCHVIDGDTIVISGTKIRIAGIDAPELEHPWGKKSKFALIQMCKRQVVTAIVSEEPSYDRIVAKCVLPDGTDVAAELVRQGLALDWPKFSGGAYSHLEPPDARKKLWRAAARQKGHMKAFNSEVKPKRAPGQK